MNNVHRMSRVVAAVAISGLCLSAYASQGLAAPEADAWWPQWQARLNLMGAPLASASLAGAAGAPAGLTPQRGIQAAALLGDYYFARPAIGNFRASGGLMLGPLGGAPLAFPALPSNASTQAATPRLGVSMLGGSSPLLSAAGSENAEAVPYLGLGYSGTLWRDSISLTADLGLVYERAAAASNASRALFGNQGMSQALRDMRLSPVLQLGMRYSF